MDRRQTRTSAAAVSVIIPTYQRESILIDTLEALAKQLQEGDEILVIDQTARHEESAQRALETMAGSGAIRWYKKERPSQCEAMNVGAWLAKGQILLFLDDDIIPSLRLLEAHRSALAQKDHIAATCGQVLQPWDEAPIDHVRDFGLNFNFAYSRLCEIASLMVGNFAMRRETFIKVGGMDENFIGSNYRNDSEMAYRIIQKTGRKICFLPDAAIRHLFAMGGNRAFGNKDSWGHIGGSIGDYYFAIRALPSAEAVLHSLRRVLRAPISRNTIRRPWVIPSLFLREVVAVTIAATRVLRRPANYIKQLDAYGDLVPMQSSTHA